MLKAASSGAKWWERLLTHYGKKKLSKLSNSFVRNWPVTTLDGREFKYPYKKRINCTMNALSNVFINRFVDKVTHVVKNERDVKLVFQMGLGGGAYQNSNRRPGTSIPHRDYVFCFVFDIFYKKNGKAKAEQLQKEMQQLVDDQFSPTQELRVFWGTFGDIDIEDPAVEQMYYNDTAKYALLQQLKRRVDSKDVFHTQISVKP